MWESERSFIGRIKAWWDQVAAIGSVEAAGSYPTRNLVAVAPPPFDIDAAMRDYFGPGFGGRA